VPPHGGKKEKQEERKRERQREREIEKEGGGGAARGLARSEPPSTAPPACGGGHEQRHGAPAHEKTKTGSLV